MTRVPALVIGAGPTGLSAAYHLGKDATLIEREHRVGGWCRSIEKDGFTFDHAGHIMFSNDPYVHELYRLLLGDNVHWQEREAWIYSKGVHTRYPFQGALYGLPAPVIRECLGGAIDARLGLWRETYDRAKGRNGTTRGHSNGRSNGHTNGAHGHATAESCARLEDCCADGRLEAEAPLVKNEGDEPRNFEEFIYRVWGAGIAEHFAIPYNRKLWTVPLDEMETSWLEGRVPLPDLHEMIEGAFSPSPKPMGPNARFGYPLRGGFQALMDGFLPHLRSDLRLGRTVRRIEPDRRRATLDDGSELTYEALVSTMPLPELIRIMGADAPSDVRDAASGLRRVSVRCVHLGIGREALTEKHWIYYPEDTVFHRIFVQGNASPHCNAPGGFGLTCEITYSDRKPLPADGDALTRLCMDGCRRVGIVRDDDRLWTSIHADMPYAYVVYDHGRTERVARIRQWAAGKGIVLAGRYSEWEYYNSDHAFLAGRKAAENVRSARTDEECADVPASTLTGRRAGEGPAVS